MGVAVAVAVAATGIWFLVRSISSGLFSFFDNDPFGLPLFRFGVADAVVGLAIVVTAVSPAVAPGTEPFPPQLRTLLTLRFSSSTIIAKVMRSSDVVFKSLKTLEGSIPWWNVCKSAVSSAMDYCYYSIASRKPSLMLPQYHALRLLLMSSFITSPAPYLGLLA